MGKSMTFLWPWLRYLSISGPYWQLDPLQSTGGCLASVGMGGKWKNLCWENDKLFGIDAYIDIYIYINMYIYIYNMDMGLNVKLWEIHEQQGFQIPNQFESIGNCPALVRSVVPVKLSPQLNVSRPFLRSWQSSLPLSNGFVWKCWVNIPNEIAIFHRDNDQQNHWVFRGLANIFRQTPMEPWYPEESPLHFPGRAQHCQCGSKIPASFGDLCYPLATLRYNPNDAHGIPVSKRTSPITSHNHGLGLPGGISLSPSLPVRTSRSGIAASGSWARSKLHFECRNGRLTVNSMVSDQTFPIELLG